MMRTILQKRLTIENKKNIMFFIMVLPTILILLYFIVIPVITSVRLSFTNWNGYSPRYRFVGLTNYINILKDRNFFKIVSNTFLLILFYVPLQNVISLLLAAMLREYDSKLNGFFKSAVFFPRLISVAVIGFIWKLMYNNNIGLINTVFRSVGLGNITQDWLGQTNTVLPSAGVAMLWFTSGFFMLIYAAGISAIPNQLYEAAEIEGCSTVQKFFYVTIPMISSSLTINIILTTLVVFTNFGLMFTLTGGGPGFASETLPLAVYNYAYQRAQMPRALAMAVVLGFLAIFISLIQLKILADREKRVY